MNSDVCAEEDPVPLLLEGSARSLDLAVTVMHDIPDLLALGRR